MSEEDIKQLVIERLSTLPPNKEVSIGGDGSFGRDELIEHVEKGDEIGKKMVEIEMTFLRSLKEGLLYAG